MDERKMIYLDDAVDAMMCLQREDEECYGASIPECFDGNRAVEALSCLASPNRSDLVKESGDLVKDLVNNCISRQDAIDAIDEITWYHQNRNKDMVIGANPDEHQAWYKADDVYEALEKLPSAQPERVWNTCDIPPNHHKDVIVRGVEAIGNVTVYNIMQWDVDRWRPENYAPSITWLDWSEI